MAKAFLLIVALTFLVVAGLKEFTIFLDGLWQCYNYLSEKLVIIFAGSSVADMIRQAIALLLISTLCAAIPATIYYFLTRRMMPQFIHMVTMVWVLTSASVALHSYPTI